LAISNKAFPQYSSCYSGSMSSWRMKFKCFRAYP